MPASIPLPVVLVGAGNRGRAVYGPLLQGALARLFRIAGVVSRTEASARRLGEALGVPWSLHLEEAVARWRPEGAVVCVSSPENASVALRVLALGLPALLETPLALSVPEAARVLTAVRRSGLPVEVAEQNPRAPVPALLLRAVEEGFLGEVRLVASDLGNYRYHAAAVARSLLGRAHRGIEARAVRVLSRPDRALVAGAVTAEGGRAFQYRDGEAAWDPRGPWVRGRFSAYGDRGCLVEDGEARVWTPATGTVPARIERLGSPVEGGFATRRLVLHGPARLEWEPALPGEPLDDDRQAIARCLLDWRARIEGRTSATAWSAEDAFQDLAWIDALEESAALGGAPVPVARPPAEG